MITYTGYQDERARYRAVVGNSWLCPPDTETRQLSIEAAALSDDSPRLKAINDRLEQIINQYYNDWRRYS